MLDIRTNSCLQGVIALNSRVTFYVPTTTNVNQSADTGAVVDAVGVLFSDLFGGATTSPAVGLWKSPACGLVRESDTLIYSYCTDAQLQAGINAVIDKAREVRDMLEQEAVSIEINGALYFI